VLTWQALSARPYHVPRLDLVHKLVVGAVVRVGESVEMTREERASDVALELELVLVVVAQIACESIER